MPLATSLAWRFGAEKGEAKDGKIDIHLNSIFVNGVKRRKIADLSSMPTHDGFGGLRMSFTGDGEIRGALLGGAPACKAFIEDCTDILKKQGGKRKLDDLLKQETKPANVDVLKQDTQPAAVVPHVAAESASHNATCSDATPGAAPTPSASSDSSSTVQPENAQSAVEETAVPAPRQPTKAEEELAEGIGAALQMLSELAPSRPFVSSLYSQLTAPKQGMTVDKALASACKSFNSRIAEKEEAHRAEKYALRVEVAQVNTRCEGLLKAKDKMEQHFKTVAGQVSALKEINQNLERKVREVQAESANAAKRAKTTNTKKGAWPTAACPNTADSQSELVRSLAEMEVSPLRACAKDGREALKKKILLKWHPDKQPSEEHKTFATQVMQELQNCAEWKKV